MWRISLLFLLLTSMLFSSCGNVLDEYEIVKQEFSKYTPNNDVALVVEDRIVYFNDHTVDLEKVLPNTQKQDVLWLSSVAVRNDLIYFVTQQRLDKVWSVLLYRCDKNGENLTVLFEKHDVGKDVDAYVWNELIYIQYEVGDLTFVDYYNCSTQKYGSFGSGANIKYKDFLVESTTYSVKWNKGYFTVIDKEAQTEYDIDDSFLCRTEYYDSLKKFKYEPFTASKADDKVVLLYRIESGIIDPSRLLTTIFVIFEYDVKSQELIFLTTLVPFDCEGIDFRYNVKDKITE